MYSSMEILQKILQRPTRFLSPRTTMVRHKISRNIKERALFLLDHVMERVLNDSRSYLYALMYAQFYGIYHHEHYW